MRLAISNIAWEVAEDEAVVSLLHRHRFDAIDIAPAKYFATPLEATDDQIVAVRDWWSSRGIEITGMQALLFGRPEWNLFGPADIQAAMLQHLETLCRIARVLRATKLVFGSPRNRDRGGLSDAETRLKATTFFRRLGDIAARRGVAICLEPNPVCYGANFLTTSIEAADFVRQTDHPAIRMQLDTGAMKINGEDPAAVVALCADLIGHVHASEPNLVPLGDGGTNHPAVFSALSQHLPNAIVSVEMVATKDESHLASIERALTVASRCYRPSGTEQTV